MDKKLISSLNMPSKHLKALRDWQATKVNTFEGKWFTKERKIKIPTALDIINRLENHWNIYVSPIFPEYKWHNFGEAWPVSYRCVAINVSAKELFASTVIHEVSHGIVECAKTFHKNGRKLKDPGHGAIWCGVYAYNTMLITNKDITGPLALHNIKQVNQDDILKFRDYFKNT